MERPEPATADSIQPLGWLAVVSNEWLVERISANIGDYFGASPQAVVGRPLSDLLGGDAVHGLRNQLALLRAPDSVARLFGLVAGTAGERFDFAVQLDGSRVVIQAERAGLVDYGDTIATIRALVDRLGAAPGLPDMFDQAARQLRALTGFDRVAVYRADAGGGATLVAQTARSLGPVAESLSPADYAALRAAPALIGDCDAQPVPLVPPGPLPGAQTRAPDTATRDRLRAAGAVASLHFRLCLANDEWGLIVCHSQRPRLPTAERLSALGLYAQMLGLLVEIRELRAA